ncbi:NAD(P)/FAD-dependent oxidoreductase [Aminivibrio sp.]
MTLLERMDRPGRKLRICGKGRGNIGNTAPMDEFLSHFGRNFRFLRPAFSHFFTPDTVALLHGLGVPTKEERGGRLFPESDSAQDLVDAFVRHARANGTTIRTGCRVGVRRLAHGVRGRLRRPGLGGPGHPGHGRASYPATGSTGDGYELARSLGHAVTPITPASSPWSRRRHGRRLQGLSLKNVRAELRVDGKKAGDEMGEMLFTHFGLSGPIILTLSKAAVQAVDQGRKAEILIDLKPALDPAKLDARLQRDLKEHGRMHLENLLKGLMPPKLIPVCLEQTGLAGDKAAHQVSAEERRRLRMWLKELRFTVSGYRPLREAIVTAGGVSLTEVNPKTMQSRVCPGLFLAGEVLDMDADTGGFNLQAALSSGYLAGLSAATAP